MKARLSVGGDRGREQSRHDSVWGVIGGGHNEGMAQCGG